MVPWKEAIGYTLFSTITAFIWGGVAYYYTPTFFWWLSPILVGLILAAPIVRYSSSIGLGVKMRKMGIFLCPSEVIDDDTLAALRVHQQEIALPEDSQASFDVPALPDESPTIMPIQSFKAPSGKKRKQVRRAQQRLKAKLLAKL